MSKKQYTINYDDSHNTYYIVDNKTDDYLNYNLEFNTYKEAEQHIKEINNGNIHY